MAVAIQRDKSEANVDFYCDIDLEVVTSLAEIDSVAANGTVAQQYVEGDLFTIEWRRMSAPYQRPATRRHQRGACHCRDQSSTNEINHVLCYARLPKLDHNALSGL